MNSWFVIAEWDKRKFGMNVSGHTIMDARLSAESSLTKIFKRYTIKRIIRDLGKTLPEVELIDPELPKGFTFKGRRHSKKTIRKIRRKLKGSNNPMYGKGHTLTGINNHNYGKKMSDEQRLKISESMKIRHANNNNNNNKGRDDA